MHSSAYSGLSIDTKISGWLRDMGVTVSLSTRDSEWLASYDGGKRVLTLSPAGQMSDRLVRAEAFIRLHEDRRSVTPEPSGDRMLVVADDFNIHDKSAVEWLPAADVVVDHADIPAVVRGVKFAGLAKREDDIVAYLARLFDLPEDVAAIVYRINCP